MNEIQLLRLKLAELNLPYDGTGLVEADHTLQVKGRAFFPVGRGLFGDDDCMLSDKKVMVLGQDFGTVADVKIKVLPHGEESLKGNPTWNNLKNLLESAGVECKDCFFTNAIMGLRLDGKNTDMPTAFKHSAFMDACKQFFIEQLRVQKPHAILALGFWPVHFLSVGLSKELSQKWSAVKNITSIIEHDDLSVARNVQFNLIPSFTTNVVVLFHPSLRGVNVAKLVKKDALNFKINSESERIRNILHK